MNLKDSPFVLIARIRVKPGMVEDYLTIALEADVAVEKSEPGMLFHNFDSDPSDPLQFTWTEVYQNDDALIAHINNPPVQDYLGKHLFLADSFEIEIYGNLANETIDYITETWDSANIPFKHFKTTSVGYIRESFFKQVAVKKLDLYG